MSGKQQVIIIGTGPAALMAGTGLLERGYSVCFYEQKKAAARKFLVAGHGGFNLSNSLDKEAFLSMYNCEEVRQIVAAYDAGQLVAFLHGIGVPTYVGSSGKIFPEKGIKPIQVLQRWIDYLSSMGALFRYESELVDFRQREAHIMCKGKLIIEKFDYMVLALGGASWPQTGATGAWLRIFAQKGIPTQVFAASNAGMVVEWSEQMRQFAGFPLKNIHCTMGQSERYGELVITDYGLEGSPIYYLNHCFRAGEDVLYIDAKPAMDEATITAVLQAAKNISDGLKQLKIARPIITYIKEQLTKEDYTNGSGLAGYIKHVPFKIKALRPIEEAISTVGGLSFEAVSDDLSLLEYPRIYCCGEMLDWDAPTGGYLLQACFAMGAWVARHIP